MSPNLRLSFRRRTAPLLLVVALALAVSSTAGAGADDIDDLRGEIPSGEDLRAELSEIGDERAELVGELSRREVELGAALAERDRLGAEGRQLAADIEQAATVAREAAVEAFVGGGSLGDFGYLVAVTDASDLAWRQYLVRNHAGSTEEAAERLRQLRAVADAEVLEAVEQADELRAEIERLGDDLADLEQRVPDLEALLPVADAWDRAEIAIEEGRYGIAAEDKWEAMRFCESTHDYGAISPSGAYRGAYQFDVATWRTVGGTGDPALASAEEQDARARELYARRGHQPWPVCGYHLR